MAYNYNDPTADKAIANIMSEEKRKERKPKKRRHKRPEKVRVYVN